MEVKRRTQLQHFSYDGYSGGSNENYDERARREDERDRKRQELPCYIPGSGTSRWEWEDARDRAIRNMD